MNSANFPSAKYCPLFAEALEVEGESEEGLDGVRVYARSHGKDPFFIPTESGLARRS